MKILSIWNQKGGVGKSTLAIHLAAGYAAKGLKVGIADMDTQRTCLTFFNNAENPEFTVFKDFPSEEKSKDLDVLICDHSPERSSDNDPVDFSDLVIIPICASAVDAWSTLPAVESLTNRKDFKKLIVVNRFQKARKLMADFVGVGGFEHDLIINERAIYARTLANFSTVYAPRKLSTAYGLKSARTEIDELIKKIEEKI